ncbi:MAG: 4-(cytidine 5'-diphospho)-2-C-methyl-D-erythritol kinase [Treponema sp.]|nr:4-(cytidine 5'-diphospho)-2-C-methyl-D-erythritol kinase [Treponema sp.]
MVNEVREFASAKINLNLKVLPVRNDGFHDIESIFQILSLKDELLVSVLDGNGKCRVRCASMSLPEKNTINMAYEAFRKVSGLPTSSIDVELIKKIPSGGGLGGGSSDAAALVRALEKIHGITLSDSQLDGIASEVGSDVFFFVHCDSDSDGCALVSGRGENVKKITRRSDLHFVLVFPNVSSSTKEAYSLIDSVVYVSDKRGYSVEGPLLGDLESIYRSPVGKWNFVNTFSGVLMNKYPDIARAVRELKDQNALFCDMSGSGSTVFGVFASKEDAELAIKNLRDRNLNCVYAV